MAAQADGDAGKPPREGWVPVTLPDIWTQRWPHFNGAVWYRIQWRTTCGEGAPLAVAVDRINMAGMLYLNDDLLWRDASLVEPLSRSWNMPRYWLLPAALLSQDNTLWFRVSGMAHDMPGLGRVMLGDPAWVWPYYEQRYWQQRSIFILNLAISLVLGCLFLIFWLVRRSESAFGWYALASLAWAASVSNTLVVSPWPFANSSDWSRFNVLTLALHCSAFCMFTWSFGEQHFPRLTRILWTLTASLAVLIWWVPQAWLLYVLLFSGVGYAIIFIANCLQFQFHAWRHRQLHRMLLAVCLLAFLVIALHDMLAILRLIETEQAYTPVSSPVSMLCMLLIIAWRFADNLRRIETFNEELQTAVEQARTQLTRTLQREHRLETSNVRLGERLQIAHDLHDSLGSSLMRSIALVEQTGSRLSSGQFLSMLGVLRDDLRQIIDNSSASGGQASATPGEWLAPLRHRFVRLFDELGLASRWNVPDDWPCPLSSVQQLALTRFVEEALTNVIKHSRARTLSVDMQAAPGGGLLLCVVDDGIGFDVAAMTQAGTGIGMRSLHARIERIGGRLRIESRPGETALRASLTPV